MKEPTDEDQPREADAPYVDRDHEGAWTRLWGLVGMFKQQSNWFFRLSYGAAYSGVSRRRRLQYTHSTSGHLSTFIKIINIIIVFKNY